MSLCWGNRRTGVWCAQASSIEIVMNRPYEATVLHLECQPVLHWAVIARPMLAAW